MLRAAILIAYFESFTALDEAALDQLDSVSNYSTANRSIPGMNPDPKSCSARRT